jgi:hypothetical protein
MGAELWQQNYEDGGDVFVAFALTHTVNANNLQASRSLFIILLPSFCSSLLPSSSPCALAP